MGCGKRGDFWQKKIERNMARDNEVDRQLNDLEGTVIRFWGNEIKKHPDFCLKAVEECVMRRGGMHITCGALGRMMNEPSLLVGT